jgi:hypothetical protein
VADRDEADGFNLLAKSGRLDAVAGADRELEGLKAPRVGREALLTRDRRGPGGDRRHVALRGTDVPKAAPVEMAVRGAADSEVLALAPVVLVVVALVAWSGPIRDLVPEKARRLEERVGHLVAPGLDVVVGVAAGVPPKRRAGLDPERVRAQVRWRGLEGEHLLDGRGPVRVGLRRRPVDEVDAERAEADLPDGSHRRRDCLAAVAATEAGEDMRGEGLYSERDAVHARGGVSLEELDVDVLWIALDGHLGPLAAGYGTEEPGELLPAKSRGGPSPEKDRDGRAEALRVGTHQLAHASVYVGRGEMLEAGPGRECAIVAAPRAERHVHVDTEAGPAERAGLTHAGRRAPPTFSEGSRDSVRAWRP